jgi:hypothetical protein
MVTNQQKITIMKKLYYFLLLLPLWGSGGLSAQVSVELLGKTNNVVSFTVSWGTKTPYDSKIWVLAQYSASGMGAEDRALITDVSATGATASTVTGHRGFWLETSGSNGSATVTATLDIAPGVEHFNWCVYAFDYPPNAVLQSDGTYQLRGSPPFTINGDITVHSNTFGPGTCIESITDLTDHPAGLVPDPPAVTVSASEPEVCPGTEVIFTATASGGTISAMTYIWDVAGTTITTASNTYSQILSAADEGTYTVYVTNANGCTSMVAAGTITITIQKSIGQATISGASSNTCPASVVMLTATASNATTFTWYRNGLEVSSGTSTQYIAASTGSYTVQGMNPCYTGATSTAKVVTINGCTYSCKVPTLTLTGVGFANPDTYTINGLIISSPVTVTTCQKEDYDGGSASPYNIDCRTNPGYDGDLISGCMMICYASALCPSPWRIPTLEDSNIIANNNPSNNTTSTSQKVGMNGWQANGRTDQSLGLDLQGQQGRYHVQNARGDTNNINSVTVSSTNYQPQATAYIYWGLTVRCVRDAQ